MRWDASYLLVFLLDNRWVTIALLFKNLRNILSVSDFVWTLCSFTEAVDTTSSTAKDGGADLNDRNISENPWQFVNAKFFIKIVKTCMNKSEWQLFPQFICNYSWYSVQQVVSQLPLTVFFTIYLQLQSKHFPTALAPYNV